MQARSKDSSGMSVVPLATTMVGKVGLGPNIGIQEELHHELWKHSSLRSSGATHAVWELFPTQV